MNTEASIITLDQLGQLAPAALRKRMTSEDKELLGHSERYSFFDTTQVVSDMQSMGWDLVEARQQGVQKRNVGKKEDNTRHMLKFRNLSDYPKLLEVGGTYPEILITNSHDGTTKFKFHMGLFRLVCGNGLVVPEKTFEQFQVRHKDIDFDLVRMQMALATELFPEVLHDIEVMKEVHLSKTEQHEFALRAMATRYLEYVDKVDRTINRAELEEHFDLSELLAVQRDEDKGNDVYTVYNRVQENLIKGNFIHITSKVNEKGELVDTSKKARALDAPKSDIRKMIGTNKELWSLAKSFAHLKN